MPIIGARDLEVWIKGNGSREPYLDPLSWAGDWDASYAVDVSRMWCRHLGLGAGRWIVHVLILITSLP